MALKPLQATMPLGQFDVVDAALTSIKGGEAMVFAKVTNTSATDLAAADAFDGYLPATFRACVTRLGYVTGVTVTTPRPLMLADDGIAGYGTLFGSVVGGTVGQQVTNGAVLGPHTATGSGKVTCWSQPGLYAVSLDAVAADLQANGAASSGSPVYATSANNLTTSGVLTLTSGGANAQVGNFVEFVSNGSLVNTPNYLVAALNSPSGSVSSVTTRSYAFAVLYFNPALT